ncbi:MFS transporter [Solitalea koreensis]|uniref:Major Facilitator Superfamily protein n=1 Tax=Solitalea koreensis TaxID=543615 RepID=A0A521BE02_9SPHI|nr:MFS transporter [Solitalea koreensis]SMO45327.1 Major Facilitator Superfamily protein [Solitalea koreensis]
MKELAKNKNIVFLIIVAALGYFVDIYDLILFSVIRVKSLKGLGITNPDQLLNKGVFLINCQMVGMLIGGILWGILGDKKGRLWVLFGSILTYSIANIANGFVVNVEQYAILRFIAGVGLAGELGAGITLITESMSKENRGYGTMLIAGIGLLGAVVAAQVGGHFDWQTAYLVGGIMGLVLLVMRIGVFESGMFHKVKTANVEKGNFLMLLSSGNRFKRFINSILIAVPVWFVIGILVTFADNFGKAMGATEELNPGKGIMYAYIGIALGDFLSGTLSQVFKTRKKIVYAFLTATLFSVLYFLNSRGFNAQFFHIMCFIMGLATGYWVVFVTMGAEQFGTNLRATVATSVPNFVRGSVVLVTLAFKALISSVGVINSGLIVGCTTIFIAYIALWNLEETYGKDLDYVESDSHSTIKKHSAVTDN